MVPNHCRMLTEMRDEAVNCTKNETTTTLIDKKTKNKKTKKKKQQQRNHHCPYTREEQEEKEANERCDNDPPHTCSSSSSLPTTTTTSECDEERIHRRIMGTLRGRLRQARKQITWCAFPVGRRARRKMSEDSVYESAFDVEEQEDKLRVLEEEEAEQLRNPNEVGQTCRGSINLQEARILTDKATSCIVISGQSQTFHVKPHTEMDRQQWINSLEYMKHKAVTRAESEEDDDNQLSPPESNRSDAFDVTHRHISGKLCDLKTAANMMNKQGDELMRALNAPVEADRNALAERADLLKMTTAAVLQAAEEFVELSELSAKRLGRMVAAEQKEKVVLQEQLEALAKQHSSLERAATNLCNTTTTAARAPLSVYSQEDEEFHDAEEHLTMPCNSSTASAAAGVHITPPSSTTNDVIGFATCQSASSSSSSGSSPADPATKRRQRRTTVPERPDLPINLWSIMKNCIGKELSKIPMPVNFSEPISVLQRVTEDLEYADLLEKGAKLSTLEQMCYVAAYAASNYSTTCHRTNKPFNPLLGETFEFDRMDDLGWRSVTEQVSHHPPAAAHHAEGRGWTMYQDFTMTSRFRGKYLSVIPIGFTHVVFPTTGSHFSYRKITTTVHNIIVGKLWIDNHGDMEITNHTTNEKCVLKFVPYSYFSREQPRKVYGIVRDSSGVPKYVVQGTWDKSIDMLKVSSWNGNHEKPKVEVDETSIQRIWTAHPLPKNAEKMHNFTKFTIELNEPETGVAPTDSRLRPDQRMMENGEWDEANRKKLEIEEKQRTVRRRREAQKDAAVKKGEDFAEYQPTWFRRVQDEANGALIHQYKGGYWESKKDADWSQCPDIF